MNYSQYHPGSDQTKQEYYFKKWKKMKKKIKDIVFVNAAICDEVVRVEEKASRVREERRYLLRKLLQFQSVTDIAVPGLKPVPSLAHPAAAAAAAVRGLSGVLTTPADITTDGGGGRGGIVMGMKGKMKKKSGNERKKTVTELLEEKAKPKKSKSQVSNKKLVPRIPLDPLGRPVFPLAIGELTIHSLGEIVPERMGFHTAEHIFPVGFCSTRVYASTRNAEQKCLYTCKISDGGAGPWFEISPEDSPEQIIRSQSASECHCMLLKLINKARGHEIVSPLGAGPEFFGLPHPIVQNLIQSCPGARKCSHYKWIKFEVSKTENISCTSVMDHDPTISVEALWSLPTFMQGLTSTVKDKIQMSLLDQPSLRSLLTSGSLHSTTEHVQK